MPPPSVRHWEGGRGSQPPPPRYAYTYEGEKRRRMRTWSTSKYARLYLGLSVLSHLNTRLRNGLQIAMAV